MKLSAVQAYLAAQIAANATLSAFGAPIISSLEEDETALKELTNARLRDPGIVIVLREPDGASILDLHPGGYSKLRAVIEVLIAEKIAAPTHTPRGLELVELVVGVLTGGRQPVEWQGYEPALLEHGYSLNVLTFSIPVTVTK